MVGLLLELITTSCILVINVTKIPCVVAINLVLFDYTQGCALGRIVKRKTRRGVTERGKEREEWMQ